MNFSGGYKAQWRVFAGRVFVDFFLYICALRQFQLLEELWLPGRQLLPLVLGLHKSICI